MYDPEKSDSGIVVTKPTNKAGRPVAEPAEPRPGTKGNAEQQSRRRGQSRGRVSQALGRVQHAPGADLPPRAPGAGPRTASRKAEEEGPVHRAPAPYPYRYALDRIFRA